MDLYTRFDSNAKVEETEKVGPLVDIVCQSIDTLIFDDARKRNIQAGAELCQAQQKLGLAKLRKLYLCSSSIYFKIGVVLHLIYN